MSEEIGKHKGAVETLLHEKKELSRLLQIVNSQLQRHLSALEDAGVDTDEFVQQLQEDQQVRQKQEGRSRQQSRGNSQRNQSRERNRSRGSSRGSGGRRNRSRQGRNQSESSSDDDDDEVDLGDQLEPGR